MKYNMEKFQKAIERKFNKGFEDGRQGVYNPGSTFGALRRAYIQGCNEGKRTRQGTFYEVGKTFGASKAKK